MSRICSPLLLAAALLLLAFWIYLPGVAGPALLDDHSNVLIIDDLDQHPELAGDYIFGNRSGPLGRPVSIASFVLEKLWLGNSVSISKRVNIGLHLLNGVLVSWVFLLLFGHIRSSQRYIPHTGIFVF